MMKSIACKGGSCVQIVLVAIICWTVASCNSHPSADADQEDMTTDTSDVVSQEAVSDTGKTIVNYAKTLVGTPYKEAGRDVSGFDCSGFVYYVFKKHHIELPHSSRHLARLGNEISIEEAKEGDLVFFRGTNPASTEVGHVGIVVSGAGEPIKFIHASSAASAACVRFDSLVRPNYQRRFLMVKRVL